MSLIHHTERHVRPRNPTPDEYVNERARQAEGICQNADCASLLVNFVGASTRSKHNMCTREYAIRMRMSLRV